jgi:hypothetical protein
MVPRPVASTPATEADDVTASVSLLPAGLSLI